MLLLPLTFFWRRVVDIGAVVFFGIVAVGVKAVAPSYFMSCPPIHRFPRRVLDAAHARRLGCAAGMGGRAAEELQPHHVARAPKLGTGRVSLSCPELTRTRPASPLLLGHYLITGSPHRARPFLPPSLPPSLPPLLPSSQISGHRPSPFFCSWFWFVFFLI